MSSCDRQLDSISLRVSFFVRNLILRSQSQVTEIGKLIVVYFCHLLWQTITVCGYFSLSGRRIGLVSSYQEVFSQCKSQNKFIFSAIIAVAIQGDRDRLRIRIDSCRYLPKRKVQICPCPFLVGGTGLEKFSFALWTDMKPVI